MGTSGAVCGAAPRQHSLSWPQGRCVLALEQTQPGGLANDSGLGGLIVIKTRVAGGGVIAAGDASGGNAAIRVRGEDSTGLVYRKVIEVQKVPGAAGARSPLGTDHPELHGIVGRGIHSETKSCPRCK